jgi:fatty-acyl-CoA synthase
VTAPGTLISVVLPGAPGSRVSAVRDQGIGSWIERRARIAPDAPAVISGSTTWSNAAFAQRVRRLARGLGFLGVSHGDRVCWLGANHPAFLELLFASARLGAILAPVNHLLDGAGIRAVVDDVAPELVVRTAAVGALRLPPSVRTQVVVDGAGTEDALDFGELSDSSPDEPVDEPVALTDVCLLPHTSGTTGAPKGVMLTHGNITWNAVNFLTSADIRGDDVTIAIAPFFRVGGTGVNVLPVLFRGGAVVVPEDPPDPPATLRLLHEHRVTIGFGNPDLLDALTRSDGWSDADLSSVRFIITGGASVPERLLRAFLDRGVPCLQGYGLSEAGPLVLLSPAERALDKVGSAGVPPLLVDVRVIRPDGTSCLPHETGELLVQGPNVMAGYWQRPEETARTIDADGWLHSGDAAFVDDDGYYWIVDRLKDAYETAGGRVYPAEVDRVVLRHPAVADAASVGVATTGGMAETHTFVVKAEGADVSAADILRECESQLPAHAAPVVIRFVHSVPRNSVGKVIRERLRDQV